MGVEALRHALREAWLREAEAATDTTDILFEIPAPNETYIARKGFNILDLYCGRYAEWGEFEADDYLCVQLTPEQDWKLEAVERFVHYCETGQLRLDPAPLVGEGTQPALEDAQQVLRRLWEYASTATIGQPDRMCHIDQLERLQRQVRRVLGEEEEAQR
jgi:hypothetical protein